MAKKLTKKQLKEDKFVESIFSLRSSIIQNQKPLAIGGICIVLVILIIFLSFKIKASKNQEALTLFGKGMMELQSGKYSNAIQNFQKVYENYSGSKSAPKALFFTGNIYYKLGNYKLAIQTYKTYLNKYNSTEFLNASILNGIGCSYMQTKNYDKAIAAFKKALDKYNDTFIASEVQYHLATCYIKQGENNKAKQELKNLINKNKNSLFLNEAKLLLAEL